MHTEHLGVLGKPETDPTSLAWPEYDTFLTRSRVVFKKDALVNIMKMDHMRKKHLGFLKVHSFIYLTNNDQKMVMCPAFQTFVTQRDDNGQTSCLSGGQRTKCLGIKQ